MSSTIYNTTTGNIIYSVGENDIPATETTNSIPGIWSGTIYRVDVNTLQPVLINLPADNDGY